MFRLQSVSFRYDEWIFREASCCIDCSKIGIVGKNGVGKTTLLHLINGDVLPESGEIKVSGNTYFVDFSTKNYTYFTIQEIISLCETLDGFENIFEELIEMLSLKEMLNIPLGKLSLGSYKKVFLMLGLASKNEILLLDEPFENIDAKTNDNIVQYIASHNKEVVIVSHRLEYLFDCTQEIYEVKNGELIRYEHN